MARQHGKYVMVRLAEEHGTDLAQYRPLLFHGKELSFMSGTTATVVNHRPQQVLLLHLGATVSYELSCLSGLSLWIMSLWVMPSSSFFNSDRTEQFRSTLARSQVKLEWMTPSECQLRFLPSSISSTLAVQRTSAFVIFPQL